MSSKSVYKCFSLVLLLISDYTHSCFSQNYHNLVVNPSFEIYDTCPYNICQGYFATGWENVGNTCVDYFNICASNQLFGVPYNDWGVQFASAGNAYSQIAATIMYKIGREYLGGSLIEIPIANTKYSVTFNISLAESSSVACDQVGLYLSNQKVITPDTNYFTLSNITPQVVSAKGAVLIDSINWVKIQGSFIANGNEKFLTIGIFVPNDSINWLYRHYWWLPWCEYFVDEVYIYQSSLPINAVAGNDTLVCIGDSLLLGVYNYTDEQYQWTSDDGFFSTEAQPAVSPIQTTCYYLKLINFKNEISYDTICVFVEECFDPPVIPNVFTPNGDGRNDALEIRNPGNYPYSLYIYNRWGKLVFTGNESRAWDGCENGNPASESVYFFSLKLEHPQFRKEYSGSIQLMR